MNKKINLLQFCSLYIVFVQTFFLAIGLHQPIKNVGVDSWFTVLFGNLLGFICVFLFIYIFNYEADLTLQEKINKLFGKKIGSIFNILLFIIAFVIAVNVLYDTSSFIISHFLSETPYLYIAICLIALAIYLNTKGFEVLSRVSFIIMFLTIILFTIATLNLFPKINIENFKPILAHGLKKPIISSLYFIVINLVPNFFLLVVPKNSIIDNQKHKKYILITYSIAIILMILSVVQIIGNLGIYLASYYQYPEYMTLKHINYFDFINKIENFIISQWILESFISLSLIIHFLSSTIKTNYNKKIIPLILGIAILITSKYSFSSDTIYNFFSLNYMPFIRVGIIIIVIITAITIFIKQKKSKVNL